LQGSAGADTAEPMFDEVNFSISRVEFVTLADAPTSDTLTAVA